ncbi:MAG: gephyrin-like molybdotransferase Glp [Terracidiphilus sp.]|jgi:molybdopterin molybdotransferase
MDSALPSYGQAAALVAAYAAQPGRFRPGVERIELAQAAGRILTQPLLADRDQPPFARSTRDGYACRAAEANTHAPLAIAGASRAGDSPAGPLPPGAAWEIMAGAPIPTGTDAVIPFDRVKTAGAKTHNVGLLSRRNVKPGENIVAQGAQARAGEELLPAGTAIGFGEIALAAACGYALLEVFRRPRVAILSTGDELVPVESSPAPGQIRNSNSPMLAALVAATGGEPWLLPTAADNAQALDEALALAATADLLLISGGVSAGKFDLVEPALARIGARFHFTGLRIQPGRPTVFGELPRGAGAGSRALPFFGLPGNPVASAVTFLLFAAPVLTALAGSRESRPRFVLARLSPPIERGGKAGLTRFLPAFCDFAATDGQPPQVALVPWHGSGDLLALARSNCFVVVPEDARSLKPGSLATILVS